MHPLCYKINMSLCFSQSNTIVIKETNLNSVTMRNFGKKIAVLKKIIYNNAYCIQNMLN